MEFQNECGCKVDLEILQKALEFRFKNETIPPKTYRILENSFGYAFVSVNGEKLPLQLWKHSACSWRNASSSWLQ